MGMNGKSVSIRRYLPVLILAVLMLMPLAMEQYKLYVGSLVLIYVILAIGLNLTLGYAGQISLAHAAFMAIGAYSVALLQPLGVPFELTVIVGALIAFALGVVVGFPALRVKHHFLAMVTLGFTIIVFLCLRNFEKLTGGNFGITGVMRPNWGFVSFRSDGAFYVYTLFWAIPLIAFAYWLLHSRWGRAFKAIRENEMRAEALGVSLRNYKLMAFAIGAAFAGVGGALFAPLVGYIDPSAFFIERSILFLMMVVIGGLGRFEGPFIGAIVVVVLPEILRASEGLYLVFFAISIILMMLFMPKGLIGIWDMFVARFVTPRPAPAADAKPAEFG
jgi:branched-chain amino acid transport system permease protein